MAEHIDLKELERKAYLSYHQDGIADIFVGLATILIGIMFHPWFFEDGMWYVWGIYIIFFSTGYAGAKRAITVPRLGYVEFTKGRRYRMVLLLSLLVLINLIFFFFVFLNLMTLEVRLFLNEYGLVVMAFIAGGLFILFGLATNIRRLLGYGAATIIFLLLGHVFVLHLTIPIVSLGMVITVTGFVLLFRFLRKYPKGEPSEDPYDNWENSRGEKL